MPTAGQEGREVSSRSLWFVKVLEGPDEADVHGYDYVLDAVWMPGGELESVVACAKVLEVMCSRKMRLSFMVPPGYIRVSVRESTGGGQRREFATMTALKGPEGYRDTAGKPIGEPDENVVLHEIKSR